MKQPISLFRQAIVVMACLGASPALPQVPPHYPGTVCFTPFVWCQLPGAVPVGSRCFCNTPSGQVFGQAG